MADTDVAGRLIRAMAHVSRASADVGPFDEAAIAAMALVHNLANDCSREYKLALRGFSEGPTSHEYDASSDLLALAVACPVPGLTTVEAAHAAVRCWTLLFSPLRDNDDHFVVVAVNTRARRAKDAVKTAAACLPSFGEAYRTACMRFGGRASDRTQDTREVLVRMRRVCLLSGLCARRFDSRLPKGSRWPMQHELHGLSPAEHLRCATLIMGSGFDEQAFRHETRVLGAVNILASPTWLEIVPTSIDIRLSID